MNGIKRARTEREKEVGEGERLALQDRPRLDAEIEAWATGISSEEIELWFYKDLEMWRKSFRPWREKDVVDMKEVAKDMIEKDFDHPIRHYSPQGLLLMAIADADPPAWPAWGARDVNTHGAKYAMKASISSPLMSIVRQGDEEEEVDMGSVEFQRECHNDVYVVKGRLRKMKELYMQVFSEMGLIKRKVGGEEESETSV